MQAPAHLEDDGVPAPEDRGRGAPGGDGGQDELPAGRPEGIARGPEQQECRDGGSGACLQERAHPQFRVRRLLVSGRVTAGHDARVTRQPTPKRTSAPAPPHLPD